MPLVNTIALCLKAFGVVGAYASALAGIALAADASISLVGEQKARSTLYKAAAWTIGALLLVLFIIAFSEEYFWKLLLRVSLVILAPYLVLGLVWELYRLTQAKRRATADNATVENTRAARVWSFLVVGFVLILVQETGEFVLAALGR